MSSEICRRVSLLTRLVILQHYFSTPKGSAFYDHSSSVAHKLSHHDCVVKDHADYSCRSQSCKTKDDGTIKSCQFYNICLEPKTNKWLYFHDGNGSSLPLAYNVDKNGSINWDGIFGSWGRQSGIYYDTPSDYEKLNGRYHFHPTEVLSYIPFKNVSWRASPHVLFARTPSDDNLGHVLFDTYIPLLSSIDHWLNIRHAKNVVVVDDRDDSDAWIKSKAEQSSYFRQLIASTLFSDQTTLTSIRQGAVNSSIELVCFDKLLVGTGGQEESGLHAGMFLHNRPLQYMKKKLIAKYGGLNSNISYSKPSSSLVDDTLFKREQMKYLIEKYTNSSRFSSIRILMIEKEDSNTGHTNFIENWAQLHDSIAGKILQQERLNRRTNVTLLNISPRTVDIPAQVALLHHTDIVISLWGGVSSLNFLLPRNRVQIVIVNWWPQVGGE